MSGRALTVVYFATLVIAVAFRTVVDVLLRRESPWNYKSNRGGAVRTARPTESRRHP